MTTDQVASFINERRAVGGQSTYAGGTATPTLRAELLEQRKREFYLAATGSGTSALQEALPADYWPKGVMPGLPQQYGSDECWPMDINELNGNRNARS